MTGAGTGDGTGDDSDEALLRRWQAEDRRAGQQLARRYFPLLRSYFRIKAPADYSDLVAKTFLRLVEKHDSFRGEGSFRCFVLGIARKILLESFRAQKRDQRIDPLVTTAHDLGGRGLLSQLSDRQEHILLVEALRRSAKAGGGVDQPRAVEGRLHARLRVLVPDPCELVLETHARLGLVLLRPQRSTEDPGNQRDDQRDPGQAPASLPRIIG
ncbi:MAG: sigma-70 family RNA polymerase sigma factor [Myxococcales bacterium]|nr:sigma-70 family RNA polymerase sigma factor [Myxococcales bacterium]